MIRIWLILLIVSLAGAALGQEQIDKGDPAGKGVVNLANIVLRVKVTKTVPEQKEIGIQWRRGGEGLGGLVTRGAFAAESGGALVEMGKWSKAIPVTEIAGKDGAWRFPTIVVAAGSGPDNKGGGLLADVAVDFEFSEGGKVARTFTEIAPKGATVGFVLNGTAKDRESFFADLASISEHAHRRHERLAKLFPEPAKMPKLFGVIGHLAGYGERPGYGVRHSNPAIVKEECETLKLLGVNGLVGENSVKLADAAGVGKDFRHTYWGGPGSGSPLGLLKVRGPEAENICPFDPELLKKISEEPAQTAAEHQRVGSADSWGLWWDEIGVAAKAHLQTCPRCREKFTDYLKAQHVEPAAVGAKSWDEVKPYPIWPDPAKGANAPLAAAPTSAVDCLRYYYTHRFMTEATAQLFVEPAKALKQSNVLLYAMQGPTPSWSGHSLDWHEFYDRGANTAFVFETSNRDPRTWQFESYLADIGRGICERHNLPMGVLVKPHRGAVEQRMLSVVARGAKVIEWYTYGPDYAKGDSFSQSPELLERVAKAARFLCANEDYLYGAKPAVPAQVAFCSPRSSEIWGKAGELGVTAFEDAKWVYIALRHANIAVDVISEQQIAEGKLDKYNFIYVVGPNLRRDAAASLKKWVEVGHILWTDAMGLSRDEANQPVNDDLTGLKNRTLETWGTVEPYKATDLKPFIEKDPPAAAEIFVKIGKQFHASVGREVSEMDQAIKGFPLPFGDKKLAFAMRSLGKGQVITARFWAGLTYSAVVRRQDFDMSRDFDPTVRQFIGEMWADAGLMPVTTSSPVIEAVPLVKDGRRSVGLMNWAYRRDGARGQTLIPIENLRISLRNLGEIKRIRSTTLGQLNLAVEEQGVYFTTLPKLNEIDLLILE